MFTLLVEIIYNQQLKLFSGCKKSSYQENFSLDEIGVKNFTMSRRFVALESFEETKK